MGNREQDRRYGVKFKGEMYPKNFRFKPNKEHEELSEGEIIGMVRAVLGYDFDRLLVFSGGVITAMSQERYTEKYGHKG